MPRCLLRDRVSRSVRKSGRHEGLKAARGALRAPPFVLFLRGVFRRPAPPRRLSPDLNESSTPTANVAKGRRNGIKGLAPESLTTYDPTRPHKKAPPPEQTALSLPPGRHLFKPTGTPRYRRICLRRAGGPAMNVLTPAAECRREARSLTSSSAPDHRQHRRPVPALSSSSARCRRHVPQNCQAVSRPDLHVSDPGPRPSTVLPPRFKIGDRIVHQKFGAAASSEYRWNKLTVNFDAAGAGSLSSTASSTAWRGRRDERRRFCGPRPDADRASPADYSMPAAHPAHRRQAPHPRDGKEALR